MRISAVFIVFVLLLILLGCNDSESVDIVTQEPASVETPANIVQEKETDEMEVKSTPEPDSSQIENVINTSPTYTPTPESAISTDTDDAIEPVLLDTLIRNCQITQMSENFGDTGLQVGEMAVNFTLKDIDGNEHRLSRFLAEKPVVMIFGSFT